MKSYSKIHLFFLLIFFIQSSFSADAQSAKLFSIISDKLTDSPPEESDFELVKLNTNKKTSKEAPQKEPFGQTLPQIFNTIQGEDNAVLIPKIDILLSNNKSWIVKDTSKGTEATKGTFFTARFFTAATKFDTSSVFNGVNFLLPEVSRYGFNAAFARASKGPNGNTVFFSVDLFLLGKEIPKLDDGGQVVGSSAFAAFHSTLSLECLYKDIVSIYGSVHTVKALTNHNDYQTFFGLHNAGFKTFFEIGLTTEFVLDKKDKENILILKIGFIPKNGQTEVFIDGAQSKNDGIPIIEFKYSKRFKL